MPKPQRVRDPIHNLIEFDQGELECTLWRAIQTEPFQRLRRIKQLGFSELVFPGATHTRFAHSIGVFHTARMLLQVILRHDDARRDGTLPHRAQVALAAALVHDVGHGMFSHAFEAIGKSLDLPMAQHETVSGALIQNSELTDALNKELGPHFASEVAALVAQRGPGNLYDAIVSSQFDADRLDYMQRDRMMSGVQSSGIDLTWLLANLEVASVRSGADEDPGEEIRTLVLGPKAVQTAESYVLSLFHLYPNVYLHKTTRAAEMLFGALMRRLLRLGAGGHEGRTGLPHNHPILCFAREPGSLKRATALDDMVFWGALPLMIEAEDREVVRLATAMMRRRLPICIDLQQRVEEALPKGDGEPRARRARVSLTCSHIETALREQLCAADDGVDRVMFDRYERPPYKHYGESQTPLSRILIRKGNGAPQDMAEMSSVVAGAETFLIRRVYTFRDDMEAKTVVENIMRTEIARLSHADA